MKQAGSLLISMVVLVFFGIADALAMESSMGAGESARYGLDDGMAVILPEPSLARGG